MSSDIGGAHVSNYRRSDCNLAIYALPMPVYAQGQQPDIVKLKADAQNTFNIISSDKLKTRVFCEMLILVINSTKLIGCTTLRKLRRSRKSWTNWNENCLNILHSLAT
jgi:hypothetical protein